MRHGPILEVRLQHEFYADGTCPDFAIAASAATEKLLRRHRCVATAFPGGLRILGGIDEHGQPLVPFAAKTTLRFLLRLRSSAFFLFTVLPQQWSLSGQLLRFRNYGASGELLLDPQLELPFAAREALEPLEGRDIFACIDIDLGADREADTPPTAMFKLQFQARQVRWVYYVITGLAPQDGELRIIESEPRKGEVALAFAALSGAEADLGPRDAIAEQLAQQHPNDRCVRMISDRAIACRQQPGKRLQLYLDNERVSGNLPLPSLHSLAREDVLYRVVKYRSQQTP